MAGKRTRVIVAGCGYAGATAARELARLGPGRLDVAAIDSKPFLYNYSALPRLLCESLPFEQANVGLDNFFRGSPVTFIQRRVERIDAHRRIVSTESDDIAYDYLILALGARAIPLAQDDDAFVFYPKSARHLGQLRELLHKTIKDNRREPYRFAIVGGGLSGVEFAAALRYASDIACGASGASNRRIEVHVLERRHDIAPELPPRAGKRIAGFLADHGVQIHCGVHVERVLPTHDLVTSTGTLPADAVLCLMGSHPNVRISLTDISLHEGALRVNECLQLEGHQNIFALGDNMALADRGVPPGLHRASQAIRQGRLVSRNILRHIDGRPLRQYRFRPGVTAVSVGYRTSALVWRDRTLIGKSCDLVKRYLESVIS